MSKLRTLVVLSGIAHITACATVTEPAAMADAHASHHPAGAAAAPAAAAAPTPDRMNAMRPMHDKMMNAKTPAQRQDLMDEHMKAMQDGMQLMKRMGGDMASKAGMG